MIYQNSGSKEVNQLIDDIFNDYRKGRYIDDIIVVDRPDRDAIKSIIWKLIRILFPGFYVEKHYKSYNSYGNLTVLVEDILNNLTEQIAIVLKYRSEEENPNMETLGEQAYCIALNFLSRIPKIREYVDTDTEAAYEGDPAAYNKDEVVISYPGLLAITIYRLAHELFQLNIPLIPRMMTEYAHSKTGIDIHPGATIGKYFFIDHGTGIVVGSTTVIGDHVKIYQGVTLGALSTRGGQNLRGIKRHPQIEDCVTIYSGASILGGNTIIGEGSVIGSNVFLTKSVPPGTRVGITAKDIIFRDKDGTVISEEDIQKEHDLRAGGEK